MSKVDKKFVSDIDEGVPSFEFLNCEYEDIDPICVWESYRANVQLMVKSLDTGSIFTGGVFKNLDEIYTYLNMFLNIQALESPLYWEEYKSIMDKRPMTDLKFSIHYWAMKNWFNCKEDESNSLIMNCYNQIKNNDFILENSVS
jgi:hypothetical protein